MDDDELLTHPCQCCGRFSCRCLPRADESAPDAGLMHGSPRLDWTPWWTALAGNA